jgi:fucose permease
MALAIVAVLAVEVARGRDVSGYGVAHSNRETVVHRDLPGRLPNLFKWTLVTMACTASVEFCVSLWASRLLRDQGHLGNAAAAASLGCIFGGMFVARLAVARWATRIDSQPIYIGSLILTLVSFLVFWTSQSGFVMTVALLLCGIGIAPHFPLGMSRAMVASGGRQDRAAAATLAMSGFASGVSPFALGALADRIGVHSAYAIVLVAVVIALAVSLQRPIHSVLSAQEA